MTQVEEATERDLYRLLFQKLVSPGDLAEAGDTPFLLNSARVALEADWQSSHDALVLAEEINGILRFQRAQEMQPADLYDVSEPRRFPLSPQSLLEYALRFEQYGCTETSLIFFSRAAMQANLESDDVYREESYDDGQYVFVMYPNEPELHSVWEQAVAGCQRVGPAYAEKYKAHVADPALWGATIAANMAESRQ